MMSKETITCPYQKHTELMFLHETQWLRTGQESLLVSPKPPHNIRDNKQ
jgi:hypothetical protein